MALDLGEKRIGIALSDPTRTIASAYGVVVRRSRREDFERFRLIVSEQDVRLLVVGLPITLAGNEGARASWARNYGTELEEQLGLPVVFWDESLSTVEAEAALRAMGRRGAKAKEQVDAVAAAVILQSYLDATAQRPVDEAPDGN